MSLAVADRAAVAPCPVPEAPKEKEAQLPLEKVYTPDSKTIEAVGNYLQVPAEKCIKTLFFQADDELICVNTYPS